MALKALGPLDRSGQTPEVQDEWADLGLPAFLTPTFRQPERPVYPYSIIPGGVASSRELREAVAKDRLVAAHYQDFDLAHTRIVRLNSVRVAYVSYRLRNEIFWTRRPVTLRAGEALITDGRHFARTRCGNRLTETPPQTHSPSEPPAETLDTPQRLVTTSLLETATPLDISLTPPPPGKTPGRIDKGTPRASAVPVGTFDFFIPTGGGGMKKHCDPNAKPPDEDCRPPKPSPTPEPGTLLLVSSGAAYLLLRLKWRA
ncbi:MAG TPA: hypothetical protein VL523_06335 [Terriglobia bacterium]|nr:hypothetical protein [Terriglobia bacterium]